MCPPTEEPDRNRNPGFDQQALYNVVRAAIKDALFDVIATVFLLGVALLVVWIGARVAVSGDGSGLVIGGITVSLGVYWAAATLDLAPTITDLF